MSESLARTASGIKLYITASTPATYNKAGYEALTWNTEVGEVTNIGEYGKVYNLVTHTVVSDRRTFKRKGLYNSGSLALQLARAESDAGQILLKAAAGSDSCYSFKLEFDSGVVSDEADYFQGMVMSYTTNVGSGDQILGCTATIEIDGDIVEVAKADA